jgi:hypothetical protein
MTGITEIKTKIYKNMPKKMHEALKKQAKKKFGTTTSKRAKR